MRVDAGYRLGLFVVAATGATAGAHLHAGPVGLALVAALAALVHRCVLTKRRPAMLCIACLMAVQLMGHLTLGAGHEPGMLWRHLVAAALLGLLVDRAQGYSWTSAARDALLRLFRSRLIAAGPIQAAPRPVMPAVVLPRLRPILRQNSCRAPPALV